MSLAQLGNKNHAFGKKVPNELVKKRAKGLKLAWDEGRMTGMSGKKAWNKGVPRTKEQKVLHSQKIAKKYNVILISPSGEKFYGITNAKLFAEIHGLNCGNFNLLLNGKRKTCQGWRHE